MDVTSEIYRSFVFIDDKLIVTKGIKNEHLYIVQEILRVVDEAELLLKTGKCKFANQGIEWLGFDLTISGISPKV